MPRPGPSVAEEASRMARVSPLRVRRGLLEVGLVVGAVVKIFKFKAVSKKTPARAGVSTKPADGVLVDLELRT